jgi:hypothetical protein
MAILMLEASGPKAEELAMEAGRATEIPVGWDPEFDCATFDADGLADDELQTVVFEALASIEPEWQTHLRLTD